MNRRRTRTYVIGAIIVAIAIASGGIWLASRNRESRSEGPTSPSSASASTAAGPHHLELDLHQVRGRWLSGRTVRRKRLRAAAESIRETMVRLYTIGFVDPRDWHDGRFPSIYDLFALKTRARVRRDLADLTLGSLATRLDVVRPGSSGLDVRFLIAHNPLVAVATVHFHGVAVANGTGFPISHEGRYTLRRVNGRWRIASYEVRGHLPSLHQLDRKVRRASASPGLSSTGPFFILVIGSDARPGQSPDRARGDSLHIVGVNPARGVVSILGIPRDSYVSIPGAGTGKINGALAAGGPALMVRTVEQLTGVSIDGYVLTGFAGIDDLVNAVGGITVDVPYRMSDPYSGAYFRPGPKHLTGHEALQFSRDRHDVPGGDYGRSINQGRLLIAALRQLKHDVARNPAAIFAWIGAGAKILRTDLGLSDMVGLLLSAPSIDPAKVENRVVSGPGAVVGGQDVIRLGSTAHAMFRDLAADAIFNHRP